MKTICYRYRIFILLLMINVLLIMIRPEIGTRSLLTLQENLREMLLIMPPIFLLLGFLDVWIERETMIKYMGEASGIQGIITSFLIGSVAAGPGYMAFPFTAILMQKGASFSNILIFVGAWSATKIPISLFEASVMGWPFMLLRYTLDIPVILLIAALTTKLVPDKERIRLYHAQAR